MHAVTQRARVLACAIAIALAPALTRADDGVSQTTQSAEKVDPRVQQQVEARLASNPHVYSDTESSGTFTSSAGAEIGLGTTIPTLHTAAFQIQGRLGVAVHASPEWSILLAGQSGITLSLNTGSANPFYGYLIRIPFELVLEAIRSSQLSYVHRRYINVHFGAVGGPQFILAASCLRGACRYIEPTLAGGLGPRVGLSYSAGSRNSVGLFVTWHNDFASCPVASESKSCTTWLSTLMWTLGWTLF